MSHAFHCSHCGLLESAAHAGERRVPTSCRICGTHNDGNWEVLADAAPARLAELGLTPADVVRHTPIPKEDNVRAAVAVCKEGLEFIAAKRAHWAASRDAIRAEFQSLDAQAAALDARIADAHAREDHPEWLRLTHEKDKIEQKLDALASLEPTARDDAHEAHLKSKLVEHEAFLAGKGGQKTPQKVLVRASDGSKTRDRS